MLALRTVVGLLVAKHPDRDDVLRTLRAMVVMQPPDDADDGLYGANCLRDLLRYIDDIVEAHDDDHAR